MPAGTDAASGRQRGGALPRPAKRGIFAAADNVTLDAVLPDKEAKAENTSEPTELKLRDFMVCIDLKALNSDPDLSVPEDVKAAAVEGNTDNAMDMLSDLSDMFS